MVPWRFLPAVSRWCAGATKAGLLPAVRPGLVGVDVAEHLVPSCSVHYDVLPCRGWDLAEEEVNFSCRSLLFVVGFVVVAAVAVVAVAVTAVLLGGVAWFACGDDVLLIVGGEEGGGEGEGGGVEGSRAADWGEEVEGAAAGGAATAV